MDAIKDSVYKKLKEYKKITINDDTFILKDLSIWGDDFEELIEDLSKELNFDMYKFFELFEEKGYYNPPETYINLPKIFYLDICNLLKGKIVYHTIETNGKDITIRELIELIKEYER